MEPFLALPRSLRWAVGIFAAIAFAGVLYYFVHPSPNDGYDFQAFYCGAKVLAAHANPYLDKPLHACEAQAAPRIAYTLGHITVPSPLPPYALAIFIPLSMLPYVWAKTIWLLVLLASVVLCAWAAAKLSRLPFVLAAAGCALAIGAPALPLGALAPVPIALIFLAAFFVSRDNWNAAAVCAALAMVEPNVALPVNIALFCFVPAMRMRLSAAALALAAIAVGVAGLPTTIFYFT
ncbi:MAG: hypothetical protein M3R35_07750, partial [Candidatus Eremiobacteraeota bacterium]|nr:hypothetical protein [Candidatus Eremiobacteraeota bacterium]